MCHQPPFSPLSGPATGPAVLLLSVSLTSCAAPSRWSPSPSGVSSPAATHTPRPLRQNYAYMPGPVVVDGVANAQQAVPGAALNVTWTTRAYDQRADATPVTLSLLVYGPFASGKDGYQAMRLGGPDQKPVPVSQVALVPCASATPIYTDTWTTTPFTTTLRLPASLSAGYYDVVTLSVAGTQTVARGDSVLHVVSAAG